MALADSKTMKAMVEFREHTGEVALLSVHYVLCCIHKKFILRTLFVHLMAIISMSKVNQLQVVQMPAVFVAPEMGQSCLQ